MWTLLLTFHTENNYQHDKIPNFRHILLYINIKKHTFPHMLLSTILC